MTGLYLTDLADVIRAAGVPVVEQDGWQTRARGSGGFSGSRPFGVMIHHTASQTTPANDASFMSFGSSDRPIANLLGARDGSVWVLAAGATNTNGRGGPWAGWTLGNVPADQMNLFAVGYELANNGVGEPFPQPQIDTMFRVIIAVNRAYGCAVDDVYQHQPWAPTRKIDPATAAAVQGPWRPRSINSSGTWNLDDLTAEVRRRAGTTPPPEPPPGGNMSAAAVVVGDDRLVRYYVIGADAGVWQLWWDDVAHAWSPWQPLGGGIVGDLTATATPGSPRIDVAGRGGDGALWATTWDGMAWLPWSPVAAWP